MKYFRIKNYTDCNGEKTIRIWLGYRFYAEFVYKKIIN